MGEITSYQTFVKRFFCRQELQYSGNQDLKNEIYQFQSSIQVCNKSYCNERIINCYWDYL